MQVAGTVVETGYVVVVVVAVFEIVAVVVGTVVEDAMGTEAAEVAGD